MNLALSRLISWGLSVAAATMIITGGGTLAGVATGTVPVALAQDQPGGAPPEGARHGRMGKILMSLNLTDAQKTQIRAIMADARKQNQNVTDRDARRANMKAAFDKVDTVLTPAQRTELHSKLAAARQQPDAHAQ